MENRALSVNAIYALFGDPGSAELAVDRLRAAGVADADITVISSEPFDGYDFGPRNMGAKMPWIAGAAGVVGLVVGSSLTVATQRAWPLPTGGMPIVSMWPNLIIMFELTMLFAILGTVAALLWAAKLPGRKSSLYDPEVSNGLILVGIEHPHGATLAVVEETLAASGGRVKTTGLKRP
jgi:Protein of unknown function (DUF3341)